MFGGWIGQKVNDNWTDFRDSSQAGAVMFGNYLVPGSSLLTSHLVTKGAQKQLGSDLGRIGLIGSGLAGAGVGSEFTGIPESGGLASMFGSGGGEAGLSSDVGYQNGADMGGAGSSPATTGDMSSMTAPATTTTAAPALTQQTVSQGNNVPDYGTAGGEGNYGYDMGTGTVAPATVPSPYTDESLAETTRLANQNAMATGTPVGQPAGFLPSLTAGNFGDAASAAGSYMANNPLGTAMVGSSLYDMYAKRQMARKQEQLYNQNRADILNMYAPGSPEAIAMEREMARKDAAAGRNSQYGIRATDYAGNVAKFRTNALANLSQGQNALSAAQMGNQYGGLNSMFNNLAMYSLMNKKTT